MRAVPSERVWRRRLVALATLVLAVAGPAAPGSAAPPRPALLRVPLPRYDGTLTPYTTTLAYPLLTLVYDTLTWRDADGVPQPWLARSVRRSHGGRRVTVRLRPGVRWQDGRPLTAADVAFTYRLLARRFEPRFTPELSELARVRATSRLTVRFELRGPGLGFEGLALPDVPILPEHLWAGLPPGATPAGRLIGSGPYRLVRASRRTGYLLRARPRYFKGVPRVAELRVPLIPSAAATFAALRARRVDAVPLTLPPRTAGALAGTLGIAVARGTSYAGTALVFNVRHPPFDRAAIRRSVAGVLDLGRIARTAAPGGARPASVGVVHPTSRWAPVVPVPRAPAGASRRTLVGSGLPVLRILAPTTDPVRLEAGRQVVLALRRAGARATLVRVTGPRLARLVGEDGTPPRFDAAVQAIPALASQDPDALRSLFGSEPRGAPLNASGYRSAAFDRLSRAVAEAPTADARRRAVAAELALLARDAPAVALFFPAGAFAFRTTTYDGWRYIAGTGILDKQSFLPPGGAPASPHGGAAIRATAPGDGSSLGAFDVVSAVVLAAVVLLAGIALAQRRSA